MSNMPETKYIFKNVMDALAPAEDFSDSLHYIALMLLIKTELDLRISNCIDTFVIPEMQ